MPDAVPSPAHWRARVRDGFAGAAPMPQPEVLDELADHAADLYEAAVGRGARPAHALADVERAIRSWTRQAPDLRRRARPAAAAPPPGDASPLAGLAQDVRYAGRVLAGRPAQTLLLAGTLALGIAAITVIFSLTWGVLARPLPWADAGRLVRVYETREGGTNRFGPIVTNATYLAWREAPSTIEGLGAWRSTTLTMTGAGAAERIRVTTVTASLFPLLGAQPALGVGIAEADEAEGAAPVVVLSHGFWRDRFGAAQDVLGRAVSLDGRPYTVAGVMPPGFAFPDDRTRAWVPFRVPPVVQPGSDGRSLSMFSALAKLRPEATREQAAAEGTAAGRAAPDAGFTAIAVWGTNGPVKVTTVPAIEAATAEVRPALLLLLAGVGLLLATAVGNVASVQLARAAARRRELAIRSALGAGGARLARQLLVESLLLGAIGGAAGLALAAAAHRALPAILPSDFPRLDAITLDWRIAAFALGTTLCSSLAFGLLPVRHARRVDLVETLTEDGTAPVGAGVRSAAARARFAVMAAQVALTAILLVGAALLTRSFVAQFAEPRGYDPERVLTAVVPFPPASDPVRRVEVMSGIVNRLRDVPGVQAAAFASFLPLSGSEAVRAFQMPSRRPGAEGQVNVQSGFRVVSADYFRTLGTRVLEGRGFTGGDTATSLRALVVNQAFVREYLDDTPLGEVVPTRGNDGPDFTVVGVVEDARGVDTSGPARPEMFATYAQWSRGVHEEPGVLLRTTGDPNAVAATVRTVVREADPALAVDAMMTLEDRLALGLARPRLYAGVLAVFAAFALVIAGVGLFGVLSYGVAQRSRELAVRTALGAAPRAVVALVVRQGAVVTGIGLLAGLSISAALAGTISTLLYGVLPVDPVSYALVALVLALVAAVACAVPAWRAAKLDPMVVLRKG